MNSRCREETNSICKRNWRLNGKAAAALLLVEGVASRSLQEKTFSFTHAAQTNLEIANALGDLGEIAVELRLHRLIVFFG